MDDIGDLLALVEDDDDAAAETDGTDSKSLEEEYAKLQRKMQEIQEKMNKKTLKSPVTVKSSSKQENSNPAETFTSSHSPVQRDVQSQPSGSAFLAAFTGTSLSPCSSKSQVSEQPKTKRTMDRSNAEKELPVQKKRRVTAISNTAPNNLKESLRNKAKIMSTKQNSADTRKNTDNIPKCVEIEYYSRLRLKKSFVSNDEMKSRMEGKRFLRMSLIRSTMKLSEDCDWVTIGVISKQIERQSKNGKAFTILNLTDLDDCTKIVSFFLFGAVHEKLARQIAVGSVIGILNPTLMPPKKDDSSSFSDTPALTIDVCERVMNIGLSCDLGWCTAIKYRNKQPAGKCLGVINKQFSDVCVFHMQSKYKKASSRRSELQGATAGAPVAQKFKKTLQSQKNDQFFYGGKLYSTNPNKNNAKNGTEPKMKLTKFLANHSNLASEGKKELLEKSTVMKALSGIDGHHQVSGCSDAFATMLASGDNIAGSRQFLNHLNNANQKVQVSTTKVKRQSASEFLKEKATNLKSGTSSPKPVSLLDQIKMKKAASQPVTNFVTAADIKKATAEMFNARKTRLTKNLSLPKLSQMAPVLGGGDRGGEIDLFDDDFAENSAASVSRISDLQKKKAIAKLRKDDGSISIKKSNPNRGVLQQVQNVQKSQSMKSKILEKVNKNRGDLDEKKIEEPKKSKYGTFTEAEFVKILDSKSTYSKDVESSEIEQQEKYFNPLIKKEMMEKKMAETFEIPSKIVSCVECGYTFWGPHDRCKEMRHHLNWSAAKKKFFQCSKCKHRTTTWKTYPTKVCHECGSSKNWHRASMLKERDVKILDAETLLIRGLEHGKFINSLA